MKETRVIPVLLLADDGVVKTRRFTSPVYIGDAVNALRIFNEKEADEIVVLDIQATRSGRGPDLARIHEIASEAFMPLGYGGGINSLVHMEKLFKIGVEKIILNSAIFRQPELLRQASLTFGSQSLVVSIDVRKDILGRYQVYTCNGLRKESVELSALISSVQEQGAGEVIINSIINDGMMNGYDLSLISRVSNQLSIPLVALGGAGNIKDMQDAVSAGASAVAAGSMFVFHGRHRAVLISYLNPSEFVRT